MASAFDPLSWVAAIPGVIALLGGAVGVGALHQRVRNVEKAVEDLPGMRENLARIDERTKSTADTVKSMDGKIDEVIANMLADARGTPARSRRSPAA